MTAIKRKKYLYKYPVSVYVVYAIFVAILFACALFNLLKTLEVGNLISYYKGLEISAVLVPVLVIIGLTLVLFSSYYLFDEGKFVFKKVVKKEYPFEKLLTIKQDKKNGLTVLYVEDESKEDFVDFILLAVKKTQMGDLINDIRAVNPHVSVEIVNGTEEK